MAAVAHGVPLVCVPQGRDQHLNAERVEACGVGRSVAPDAPAAEVTSAIMATLEDRGYRQAAGRMGELIADAGEGAEAARLVEGLLDQERIST
jgi:UDP:flavonoid glycosyltransferase YjiC (YdhE family)